MTFVTYIQTKKGRPGYTALLIQHFINTVLYGMQHDMGFLGNLHADRVSCYILHYTSATVIQVGPRILYIFL
jgi:hypothetical protein